MQEDALKLATTEIDAIPHARQNGGYKLQILSESKVSFPLTVQKQALCRNSNYFFY